MSRADPNGPGDGPADDDVLQPKALKRASLPGAMRRAAVDFYFQSIRLVPANLIWGAVLLGLGWAVIGIGLWAAILAAPVLGVPLAGIYRLAGLTVRDEDVVLSDFFAAARELLIPALTMAAALAWGLALLVFNIVTGLATSTVLGWGLATLAGWGAVALVIYAVVTWPLLADPARAGEPARDRARLAGYVVLVAPIRMFGLTVVVIALSVVSTIAFVAIVTISIAYIALLSCRIVLPDADRLAERLADRRGTSAGGSPPR